MHGHDIAGVEPNERYPEHLREMLDKPSILRLSKVRYLRQGGINFELVIV
jgi:hypothetical protein